LLSAIGSALPLAIRGGWGLRSGSLRREHSFIVPTYNLFPAGVFIQVDSTEP
jgi:hypothetical protein